MKTGEFFTALLVELGVTPQKAAGFVRSIWMSASTFVIGAGLLMVYGDPLSDAIKYSAIAVIPGALLGRNLEGLWDARRAANGNVKPWDVQAK